MLFLQFLNIVVDFFFINFLCLVLFNLRNQVYDFLIGLGRFFSRRLVHAFFSGLTVFVDDAEIRHIWLAILLVKLCDLNAQDLLNFVILGRSGRLQLPGLVLRLAGQALAH